LAVLVVKPARVLNHWSMVCGPFRMSAESEEHDVSPAAAHVMGHDDGGDERPRANRRGFSLLTRSDLCRHSRAPHGTLVE
jgi:hypothetical protein